MTNWIAIFIILLSPITALSQKMEVVFCADFSGSTNGMVVELQKTIWASVNQLETENPSVDLSFGLVGYGRKSFNKENFYSEVIHDLGTPINDIGYSLVKLQEVINSCDAYAQKAMNDCIKKVHWSKDENVKKIIFFVGNGGIPMKQMQTELKKAKRTGIEVHPIYFKRSSNFSSGLDSWGNFAKNSGHELIVSEVNSSKIKFKKFYDEEFITSSGDKLASTFLPYSSVGRKSFKDFKRMINKLKESSMDNYEEMLIFQSSSSVQGNNERWDLVDLAMKGELDMKTINRSQIPVFMQGFTDDQIKKYVRLKLNERKLIVSKLRLELAKRNEFINRRQVKSQNFQGKGGLTIVISTLLKNAASELQVFAAN